jgi:uncharacterized protein
MGHNDRKSDPEDALESPIAFRPCSNGEFCPAEETEEDRRAAAEFRRSVEDNHRRAGLSRREFVESACGMAAALLVMNQVYGCNEAGSGQEIGQDLAGYDVPPDLAVDQARACQALAGDEFIFDVQIHPADPLAPWREQPLPRDAADLVKTIFVASDTTVACLSGVPGARDRGAPNVEANRQLEELVDQLAGPRLHFHVNVDPPRGPSELDYMSDIAGRHKIAAWKVYPHVGSWRLDRDVGARFLERARALGVKIIAAHRGIGPGIDYGAASSPVDLVLAAKAFPDLTFLTYHSGWDAGANEDHPFDPANMNPVGVDRLIKAVIDNGVTKAGNVYAELGSTWRNLMTQPMQAAHALGKLLKHLGEDRILWGTDSVFTGSPQEQIVALRRFQIPQVLQERHGYPALTDAARRKILGLNAARVYGVDPAAMRCVIKDDFASQLRMARREDPRAVPLSREKRLGPRTRREYLAMLRWERARG